MYTVWTPRLQKLLTICANGGLSQRVTAVYLGVTPPAVALQAQKMGLRFHGNRGGAPLGNKNALKRASKKDPPQCGSSQEAPPPLYGL